jgi:hypothetical protein
MSFDRISDFESIPVQDFDRENPPEDTGGIAWRINIDWDAYEEGVKFADDFAKLLSIPGASEIPALIVGCWEGSAEGESSEQVIEALVSARESLPGIKHLFIGEMLQEDCEVSWINQSDISPIFLGFPNLSTLRIRGMEGLSLGRPKHENLTKLILEGGGMPAGIVNEIGSAELPNLQHLELWLGSDSYGNSVTQESLQPILDGSAFPKLNYLGLRNDSEADKTATWLKDAAILNQISVLDLSLGCIGDEGAKELLANDKLKNLKQLDVSHNYFSEAQAKALVEQLPNAHVNVSDTQEPDVYDDEVYRYNFVSE